MFCSICSMEVARWDTVSAKGKFAGQCSGCKLVGKYGMSRTQYQAMYDRQGGKCAICFVPGVIYPSQSKNGKLEVDHDHITGRVRGLVCSRCNWAVNVLEISDLDLDLVNRVFEYIVNNRFILPFKQPSILALPINRESRWGQTLEFKS